MHPRVAWCALGAPLRAKRGPLHANSIDFTAHSQLVSRLAQNARSKRQNPSPLYIESTLSRSVTIACVKALRQLHNPLGAGGIGSSGEAASFVTSLSITSCSRESCCSSVGGRLVVDSSSARWVSSVQPASRAARVAAA